MDEEEGNNLIPNKIQQDRPQPHNLKFCPNVILLVNHDIHTSYIYCVYQTHDTPK